MKFAQWFTEVHLTSVRWHATLWTGLTVPATILGVTLS